MASASASETALQKLVEGNGRFVRGETLPRDMPKRRAELALGQHPFATVLTCSDSRVCPEYIFDTGLGDIFVVRTAGNVAGSVGLGSIEYAVGHLHTPLLVILGHTACGAVTAAVSAADPHAHGDHHAPQDRKLAGLVGKIVAVTREAKGDVANAVVLNQRAQAADILERSPVVRNLVDSGALKIVTMRYDLETGFVQQL